MSVESNGKPQSFLDSLGPNVEMTSEKMDNDAWAKNTLQEIGKVVAGKQIAAGMEYLGSFAVHLIATKPEYGNLHGEYDMASITQIALKEDCGESMVRLGLNNAVLQLRRVFDPNLKSGRRGDGR